MRRSISTAGVVIAVGLMAGYLISQRDALDALTSVSLWSVVAMVTASLLALGAQSYQFNAAACIHGLRVGMGESAALTASNTVANYYLPARGGMVVRAAYLKRVYRFPLSDYAALSVMLTGLTIVVATFLGLIGLLILFTEERAPDGSAAWALLGATAITVVAVLAALFIAARLPTDTRVGSIAHQFRVGVHQWTKSGRQLGIFFAWSIALFVFQALRLWLAFDAIGVAADLPSMLIIQAMALIAFVLALTPGNIGVKEGAIVFAARFVGIPSDLALLASLLDRAAAVLVPLAVSLVSAPYVTARLGSTSGKERLDKGQTPGDSTGEIQPEG